MKFLKNLWERLLRLLSSSTGPPDVEEREASSTFIQLLNGVHIDYKHIEYQKGQHVLEFFNFQIGNLAGLIQRAGNKCTKLEMQAEEHIEDLSRFSEVHYIVEIMEGSLHIKLNPKSDEHVVTAGEHFVFAASEPKPRGVGNENIDALSMIVTSGPEGVSLHITEFSGALEYRTLGYTSGLIEQ